MLRCARCAEQQAVGRGRKKHKRRWRERRTNAEAAKQEPLQPHNVRTAEAEHARPVATAQLRNSDSTVTIDVKGAALAMCAAALLAAGLAIWAVLSVLLPALRAMEHASRQLESAASAVERSAEETRTAAVPSFNSVESASREWQAVGEEVRALGTALSGPGAAVSKVGSDSVGTVASALQSWQERMSEAINAALAARRAREERIRRARDAQAWIDRWRVRRSNERSGKQLPESATMDPSSGSLEGTRSNGWSSKTARLREHAHNAYHAAVDAISNWWKDRRRGTGRRKRDLVPAVETSAVAVTDAAPEETALSSAQLSCESSGNPNHNSSSESSNESGDRTNVESVIELATEAYTEASAANRMLLNVAEDSEAGATQQDVEKALEAAEEAIEQASEVSARLRAAVFENSDDEEFRGIREEAERSINDDDSNVTYLPSGDGTNTSGNAHVSTFTHTGFLSEAHAPNTVADGASTSYTHDIGAQAASFKQL